MGRPLWIAPSVSTRASRLFFHRRLNGILHVLDFVKLDIDNVVADLLDFADINSLHDIARFGIDPDHAPRAFPFHALYGGNQSIAVGITLCFLQRLIDEMHAVVTSDGEEIGVTLG